MSHLSSLIFESRHAFAAGSAALTYACVKKAPQVATAIASRIFQNGAPEVLVRFTSHRAVRYLPALPFAYLTGLALLHIAVCRWTYYANNDSSYELTELSWPEFANDFLTWPEFGSYFDAPIFKLPLFKALDSKFDEGALNGTGSSLIFKSRYAFAAGSAALTYACIKKASQAAAAIASRIFQNGAPEALVRFTSYRAVRYLPALPFAYLTGLALLHIACLNRQSERFSFREQVSPQVGKKLDRFFNNLPLFNYLDNQFLREIIETSYDC